ncbi:MAG: hypothetical protein ACOZQL_04790 [Myxococcota bacterium]
MKPARSPTDAELDADIDFDLLDYLQTLTPAQRMARHEAALELVRALRKAGTEHYGFDPRSVATAGSGEG